jgi:hypothetical protein
MNTVNLRKKTKEELIIYIEKLSRDMTKIQEENLELRRELQKYKENLIN